MGWILKSLEVCCKWRGKKLFKGDVNDIEVGGSG